MDGMMVKRGRGRPKAEGSPLFRDKHPDDPNITLLHGRRKGSATWEALFKIGERTIGPRSLAETNMIRAGNAAIVMMNRLRAEIAAGREISAAKASRSHHTFKEVAEEVVKELKERRDEALRTLGKGKAKNYSAHIDRIRTPLIRDFGHMHVGGITADLLHAWAQDYRVREVPGRADSPMVAPSQSTMGNLAHSFGKVMKAAVRKNWIAEAARAKISKAGFDSGDNRPEFEQEEMERIERAMSPAWIADTPRRESR